MPAYLVLGADGQRYGPAELPLLVQWAQEGRIVAGTVLIDADTSEQFPAGRIAELRDALFAQPQPAPQSLEQPRVGRVAPKPLDQTHTAYAEPHAAPHLPPIPNPPPAGAPARGAACPPAGEVDPLVPLARAAWLDDAPGPKSKVVAGLLGILLGGIGAHRFYLGYVGMGILILLSNFFCFLGAIWGFVEGIACFAGKMRDVDGRRLHD
ncbi:MAG: TM2 domain-containing protein [Phycisphaerae bacterium]